MTDTPELKQAFIDGFQYGQNVVEGSDAELAWSQSRMNRPSPAPDKELIERLGVIGLNIPKTYFVGGVNIGEAVRDAYKALGGEK